MDFDIDQLTEKELKELSDTIIKSDEAKGINTLKVLDLAKIDEDLAVDYMREMYAVPHVANSMKIKRKKR